MPWYHHSMRPLPFWLAFVAIIAVMVGVAVLLPSDTPGLPIAAGSFVVSFSLMFAGQRAGLIRQMWR